MQTLRHLTRALMEHFPPAPTFDPNDIPDLTGKVIIITGANTGELRVVSDRRIALRPTPSCMNRTRQGDGKGMFVEPGRTLRIPVMTLAR